MAHHTPSPSARQHSCGTSTILLSLAAARLALQLQIVSARHFPAVSRACRPRRVCEADQIAAETVLVIEYGNVEYCRGFFDPPQVEYAPNYPGASRWEFDSFPNPNVANKTAKVAIGQVVGGSSCINGQFFDRGSRHDFDAWETRTGIDAFDRSEHRWDWEGLFPYFQKVRDRCLSVIVLPMEHRTTEEKVLTMGIL